MRILRDLRATLAEFLEDQTHGVCVLRGAREHLPFVHRLLQELKDGSNDVFLDFPHPFTDADAYVALISDCIEASARAAHGPAWTLPGPCRQLHRPAADRLRDLLICARGLLPRGQATPRLVVVLCPLEVVDPAAYRALTAALIESPARPPWFHRMRLFVHVSAGDAAALPRLARAVAFDLSPAAMAASADADAADPTLSREQRAQALLQAAMLDVGNHRFAAATRRLDVVYGEAQALERPVLAALALSGLGDAERLQHRPDAAIRWYERALVPAGAAAAPIVLLTISRQLADLYLDAGRDAEAEAFYDGAQQLAATLPAPETQTAALRGRGLAQQRLGAPAATWVASFVAAAEVARAGERPQLLADLRPQLAAGRKHALPPELRRSLDALLGDAP